MAICCETNIDPLLHLSIDAQQEYVIRALEEAIVSSWTSHLRNWKLASWVFSVQWAMSDEYGPIPMRIECTPCAFVQSSRCHMCRCVTRDDIYWMVRIALRDSRSEMGQEGESQQEFLQTLVMVDENQCANFEINQ